MVRVSEEHCFYCFEVLLNKFNDNYIPDYPDFPDARCALFVSYTNHTNARPLRGCTGDFNQTMRLRHGLKKVARRSAEDERFVNEPLREDELKDLQVGVSLLTNFKDRADIYDWTIGKHGISIEFPDPDAYTASPLYLHGTYLPEIALENRWTKEQALKSLIHKAGYWGEPTEHVLRSVRLQTYQSQKCVRTFDDYVRWKKQRGAKIPPLPGYVDKQDKVDNALVIRQGTPEPFVLQSNINVKLDGSTPKSTFVSIHEDTA